MTGVRVRGRRVLVSLESGEAVLFEVVRGRTEEIKERIDRSSSFLRAAAHQAEWQAAGRGSESRIVACPHCASAIELWGRSSARELYCARCDCLASDPVAPEAEERLLHHCDACGYYGRTQSFQSFYFYYLVVVWGHSLGHERLCSGCARRKATSMLLVNSISVLGVPNALTQLARAVLRKNAGLTSYAGLEDANDAARKGRVQDALERYARILQRVPESAGLRYDLALMQLEQDPARSVEALHSVLERCPTHERAAALLETLSGDEQPTVAVA